MTRDLVELARSAGLAGVRPDGSGGALALCPCHDDHEPSLHLWWDAEGKAAFCCHGGCEWLVVKERLVGMGLPVEAARERHPDARELVATYDYVDERGELVYQVLRYAPKDFRQRRPDGKGGWAWSLKGTPRLLFRLPELLAGVGEGETIYVTEGEKDALAVVRAGGVATCNSGGAGKWRGEYAKYFRDAVVVVIADRDEPGRRHAEAVAATLAGIAASVRIVEPLTGKDASDHLAAGYALTQLKEADASTGAPPDRRDERPHPRSDAGNAELYGRLHGDAVRYDHTRGQWFVWAGHHWELDADGRVYRLAIKTARRRFAEAASIADLAERQREAKFAIGSENRGRLEALLALAGRMLPISTAGDGWDAGPDVFAVANGVIDLETGQRRAGRPEELISRSSPVHHDPAARCPRWLRFLAEVFAGDEELVDWIWRFCGYALSGLTSEQCFLLLYGLGANGKSTFLNVLSALLGSYACNTPFATFEASTKGQIPNDLAALVGRRLVTSSETGASTPLNEARMKMLTGGDPVTARFLNREFFTYVPVAKFALAVNHKPRVRDFSPGFWRRVRLVPFEVRFEGKAADRDLEKQLLRELPGILAWAVAGYGEWRRRGLEPPAAVSSATAAYRSDSDPLAGFLASACTASCEARPAAAAWQAYGAWAGEQGLGEDERLSRPRFYKLLEEHFPKRHVRAGNVYLGVRLADAPELALDEAVKA